MKEGLGLDGDTAVVSGWGWVGRSLPLVLDVDEGIFGHEMFGCRFLSDLGWEGWY